MLFTAAWCPPCRKLKKDVLDTDDVMAAMTESFVLIKVDLSNSGENDEIARHYKVRSIPTIMAFDDEGEFIETFDDARTKGAYLHWLKECGG
jgi:thioredoxin-related protein